MKSVSKGDLIGMYYEPKTDSIVFKEVDTEDLLQASTIVRDNQETQFEN